MEVEMLKDRLFANFEQKEKVDFFNAYSLVTSVSPLKS